MARQRHGVFQLVHLAGKDGRPAYQVKGPGGEAVALVEGTIDGVLDALSASGWEVVQLVPGGDSWRDVVVRRPASIPPDPDGKALSKRAQGETIVFDK